VLGAEPRSDDYLAGLLLGQVELERIRQDRFPHEIDHSIAMSYALLARQLLNDGAAVFPHRDQWRDTAR
jgi:hypothetical protein